MLGALLLCCPVPGIVHAVIPEPGGSPPWLDYWSFNYTNTWVTESGYAPVSFTNLGVSDLGDYSAVVVDSTNAAWLRYNITEADGTNHLTFDKGSLMFWFAPNWSATNEGGSGPAEWSRLMPDTTVLGGY